MSVTGFAVESHVAGKRLLAAFDGGRLSSDGGLLLAMATERRVGIVRRLAASLTEDI
jgi:hypothetical protein